MDLTSVSAVLAERGLETERLGRLPDETLELLVHGLGITRMVMPRAWAGDELGFRAVLDRVMQLARVDMSVAWCAALYAEHPWILAHFDEQAQADVWGAGPNVPLSMSVAAVGRGTAVDGGLELNGVWPFVSGCDHAPWFLFNAECDGDTGLCLVPRSDVSIDQESWHVSGMRGTGSKTITIERAFVPRHRVCLAAQLTALAGPPTPPLFCQPFGGTLGLVLAAVSVGGAEGAVEVFRQRMNQRVLRHQQRLQATDPAAQIELAEATITARAARLLLLEACEVVRDAGERGDELSPLQLADLRLAKAHVVRLATQAIDRVFTSSGGGALQETNPLQRFWRDVHAINAHAGMNWNAHAQNYGSLAVGLEATIRRPW